MHRIFNANSCSIEFQHDSNDKLLLSQILGPLQPQQTERPVASEIPAKEQINLSSLFPTPQKPPDKADIKNIEPKGLLVPPKEKEMDPISGNI